MNTDSQIPKPQVVQSYVRNKKEIEAAQRNKTSKERADTIMGLSLLGAVAILLAVNYWRFTLSVAAIAAVAYGIKIYLNYRSTIQTEPRLKVNYNC